MGASSYQTDVPILVASSTAARGCTFDLWQMKDDTPSPSTFVGIYQTDAPVLWTSTDRGYFDSDSCQISSRLDLDCVPFGNKPRPPILKLYVCPNDDNNLIDLNPGLVTHRYGYTPANMNQHPNPNFVKHRVTSSKFGKGITHLDAKDSLQIRVIASLHARGFTAPESTNTYYSRDGFEEDRTVSWQSFFFFLPCPET